MHKRRKTLCLACPIWIYAIKIKQILKIWRSSCCQQINWKISKTSALPSYNELFLFSAPETPWLLLLNIMARSFSAWGAQWVWSRHDFNWDANYLTDHWVRAFLCLIFSRIGILSLPLPCHRNIDIIQWIAIFIADSNTKYWRERFHFIPSNGCFLYSRSLHKQRAIMHIIFSAAYIHILIVKFSNKDRIVRLWKQQSYLSVLIFTFFS